MEVSCCIAFNLHDSSVSYAIDSKIVLCLEAERYFGIKKMCCTEVQMEMLVTYGLKLLNLSKNDVKHWAHCTLNNPWLSYEQKMIQTYIWDEVNFFGINEKCLIINHHYAHCCSYYLSSFQEAISLSVDGGGDFGERSMLCRGIGLNLEMIESNTFTSAKPYEIISSRIFNQPFCEGKLMALSAYGKFNQSYYEKLCKVISYLSNLGIDGKDFIREKEYQAAIYKAYSNAYSKLDNIFPFNKIGQYKDKDEKLLNFITTFHNLNTKLRTNEIKDKIQEYEIDNVVLSGGASLNILNNSFIYNNITKNVYIPPCCDDTGQSIGGLSKLIVDKFNIKPEIELPYLGYGNVFMVNKKEIENIVSLLLKGKIIFTHNGRAEIGPRALGHRSILALPTIKNKKLISETIKSRERYRPLAPIITETDVNTYFQGPHSSPYMLFSYDSINSNKIEGAMHVDGSARVQTITEEQDEFMYLLLKEVQKRTGNPILLNTSLNLRGVPISDSIRDTIAILNKYKDIACCVFDGKLLY
jgi:carbamoyltransferase